MNTDNLVTLVQSTGTLPTDYKWMGTPVNRVTFLVYYPGALGQALVFETAFEARAFVYGALSYLQEVEYAETSGGHVAWSNFSYDYDESDPATEWNGTDPNGEEWLIVRDETCHHGMSAWLCADPVNHYPREGQY